MAPVSKDAGDAFALSASIQMLIGATASPVVNALPGQSSLMVATCMTVSAASTLLMLKFAGKKVNEKTNLYRKGN